MDSRAKQRLTGAIILAALFVLLVPELLTGPKSASTPAAPAEEEGLRSYTIDIDGKSPSAPPSATNPVPTAPVSRPIDSGTAAPTSEAAAPPSTAAAPVAPPEQRVVTETPRSAPPVTASTPVASAPVPSAPASTPAAPAKSASVPVPRGSFVVQLGSFGSRDNADRLVRDMSAKGFKAFVAPITSGGRELYRVRVGPTRDRASAEALAADLKRIGQSGSIVPIS